MEDVKGKMKGLIKKINNPFSSSPSSFKGQPHVLGSSTSSPSIPPYSPSIPRPSIAANKRTEPSISAHSNSRIAKCVNAYLSSEPKESSVEIAMKLMENVVREPGNERFRKIRMGNLRIGEAIGGVSGGIELLESVGFRVQEEDGEKWAVMGELKPEGVAVIKEAVLLLEGWRKEKRFETIDRKVV